VLGSTRTKQWAAVAEADNTKAQKAWKNAVEPQMANEGGDANEPSGRSPFWRIGSVRKPFTADAYRQGGSSEPVGEVLQQTEQQMFIHKLKLIQVGDTGRWYR